VSAAADNGGLIPDSAPGWVKSSLSFANGNCVEFAAFHGMIFLRDSKNPDGPWLRFGRAVFGEFLAAAKNGEFDSLPG
jgi:Domain of unknown function (DUF397)